MSQRLKSSLSKTLTRFYPFAGRLKDQLTISCNDEGVAYSEAQVLNCSLVDVLEKPNPKQLHLLIPDEPDKSTDLTTCPVLLIQLSFFGCGGMALGVKYNHKVADAATFCNFMTGWSESALGNVINPATPDFSASTLFHPMVSLPPLPNHNKPTSSVRTARFVFGPSELASLQAKATSTDNPRPSRFEAVTAFIWKMAVKSGKESRPECKKPTALTWAVNLRSKLQPPLPDNCFGNLIGIAVHEVGGVDGKDMSSLAGYLRLGTIDLCNNFIQALKESENFPGTLELQMHIRNLLTPKDAGAIQLYRVTSRCKFPFYDADFGWGKPLWVTNGCSIPVPNLILLMNTRDGNGIEVTVSLTEEQMTCLERDQELNNYATFNPSALASHVL